MQLDPHAILDSPTFDLGGFARELLLRLIRRAPSDEECKARIMIAYEHGHLTSEEVEFYIGVWGLAEA